MCHKSSTCQAYIMWAELGHSLFFNVPAISNDVVNHWKRHRHEKVFKMELRTSSIQHSLYGTTTVAKISLFSGGVAGTEYA